jgi:hypothetical protein
VQQTPQVVKQVIRGLRHFTGTLASYKHHPALFSTAQEVLHLSQIKGQENQIHL